MKQLLIVNSTKAVNAGLTDGNVKDLSALQEGAITFFELGGATALSAAPTKNFGIALGRANQRPFIIPEVDIASLTITKSMPIKGVPFKVVVALGTTTVGKDYTLHFFKKGTAPHERNSWTVSIKAKTTNGASAYAETAAMKKLIEDKRSNEFNFNVTISNNTTLNIEAADWSDWTVVADDELAASALTITRRVPPRGDKAYIQDLASQCAAGKGFSHTAAEGREYIPGYPEKVEDIELNNSGSNVNGSDATDGKYSTVGYSLYTLRFRIGRDSAKTRDERVWQIVHIAVPLGLSSSGNNTIDAILPTGKFSDHLAAAIADQEVRTLVKSASLN